MGADFTYVLLPICNMTEPRIKKAREIINALDFDSEDVQDITQMDKEAVLAIVEKYSTGYYEHHREVCRLHVRKDVKFYITGGLSWGDPPTSAYEEFNPLEHLLFDQLEAWAIEDHNQPKS
jgi:hypothetical protein